MKKNNDLFDREIREQLKRENRCIPDKINKVFDESIEKEKNKRDFKLKKVSGICAAVIAGTMILGITVPTYANRIPIIGKLFEVFKSSIYENYDDYTSDLNISKESNGINVTINKVIYDGLNLEIFYTIESEKIMESIPYFIGDEIKINGNRTSFASGSRGEFLEDNKVYVGTLSYSVNSSLVPKDFQEEYYYGGYVEIPDEFVFSLEINKIGDSKEENIVKGNWDFDIPVSNEKLKGAIKEEDINIDLSDIYKNTIVNKIISTPINTSIQGTSQYEKGVDLSFMVFDDKGRYIQSKSSGGSGYSDTNDYKSYFNYNFKEVYEDTKSLIFIPYNYILNEINNSNKSETAELKANSEAPSKLNEVLNLSGETKLNSKDSKEYATVTKIEVVEGKTKVYFKSDYGIYAVPTEIIDDTGKSIVPTDNVEYMENLKDLKYIHETGEFMVEFDGELAGDKYTISYYDQSKSMRIYNDKAFTVNIPK